MGDVDRHLPLDPLDLAAGNGRLEFAQKGHRLGLGALHPAAAAAVGAGEVGALGEGRLDPLPAHLEQTELADAADGDPRLVVLQGILERLFDLADVLAVAHVDEVDDDQSAQVAQPQLSADLGGGLDVGPEGGPLDPLFAGHLCPS